MKKPARSHPTWIPYFVLVVTLLLTALATYYVAMTAEAKDRLRFENAVQRTREDIQNRLETYIAMLRGGSGLFAARDRTSRDDFRIYVDHLDLRRRYPGIRGIGFSVRVMPEEKDALVAQMHRQGAENFNIRPEFERSEYHSIIYLEPLDRRNKAAIGYDMFTEPVRRAAMERARDTGAPAASGRVTLVQEIDKHKQAGFLIYVPVYRNGLTPNTVAQRRATLRGFVYSPFRANDLLEGIFGSEKHPYVDFQIYDGTDLSPSNLLHRSNFNSTSNGVSHQPRFTTTTTINVAGRPWSIRFASRPEFERVSERILVPYISLGGLLISFVLFGVTRSQARARSAAELSAAAARSSEKALRESEERFQAFMDNSPTAAWITDENGHILYLSKTYFRMFKLSTNDAVGKTVFELYAAEFAQQFLDSIRMVADTNQVVEAIESAPRPDGTVGDFLVYKFPISHASKQCLVGGVAVDITERKRAEQALLESEERFRQLSEATLEAIAISEQERVLDANRNFAQMLGYKPSEVSGMSLVEVTAPEYRELVRRKIASGDESLYEAACLRKDGTTFPTEIRGKAMPYCGRIVRVTAIRDITERKQTELALRQANEKLTGWVNELEQRNRAIALLSKISDVLQACLTVEEAYTALAQLVQPLFPQTSGGIFLISASKNFVEAVATWGSSPLASQDLFTPHDCWALRRGRPHWVNHLQSGLRCKHLLPNSSTESLCVPMMAQGQALGVLYLSTQELEQLTKSKQQLALTVAEHIGLSLANLKLRETLKNQSIRDPLTGLFNRRYMEESLEREIHRCERKQQSLGIIMLDIDHFKRFNDTFGHEAGDAVLRQLSLFLQKHIRKSDIACRYGGEELTLILPESSLEVVRQRAEQIREGAKQLQVQHRGQLLGAITLSLGVACFPEHGLTGEAVIRAADAALYRAKAEGRDAVRVAC